jgi:hypothetical protein
MFALNRIPSFNVISLFTIQSKQVSIVWRQLCRPSRTLVVKEFGKNIETLVRRDSTTGCHSHFLAIVCPRTDQYTPFDRHLDKTYNAALTLPEPQPVPRAATPRTKSMRKKGKTKATYPTIVGPPTFSFHKEYVQDVSEILRGEKDKDKLTQKVIKKYAPHNHGKEWNGWAIRSFPRFGVGYLLPAARQPGSESSPSLGFHIVRSIVLRTFNEFLYMQEVENAKGKES